MNTDDEYIMAGVRWVKARRVLLFNRRSDGLSIHLESFIAIELPYEMPFDKACEVVEGELPGWEVVSGVDRKPEMGEW